MVFDRCLWINDKYVGFVLVKHEHYNLNLEQHLNIWLVLLKYNIQVFQCEEVAWECGRVLVLILSRCEKKIAVLNSFASTVRQKYFVQKQGGSLSDFTTSLLLFFCFSSLNLELAQINWCS